MTVLRTLFGTCAIGLGLPIAVAAQAQFDLIRQDTVAGMPSLRIVIIRDTQLQACYTLFMTEPVAAVEKADQGAAPTPPEDPVAQAARRLREAADKRDRELAALRSQRGMTPGDYELARLRIDEDFDRVLREEIPASRAWAGAVAGARSGGQEETADAIRRALLDPDPTSGMKTLAGQFAHLDALLVRMLEQPRLAVSGPYACALPSAGAVKP